MAVWLDTTAIHKTKDLLAHVLLHAKNGQRVQFLVGPGLGATVVQRMRVALSRSRQRNRNRGKKIDEFSLRHDCYPYTKDGKRHDCIVMWTEKNHHHRHRELLDDLVERVEL